jgi:ubiquinone/menaquinone biosynthesis C-methylase UbiE
VPSLQAYHVWVPASTDPVPATGFGLSGEDLARAYEVRLSDDAYRASVWAVLCQAFFQRWVPRDGTFVEVGAGHCHWVNNIQAGRRIAVDLSPALPRRAAPGVETVVGSATQLEGVGDASADVVAMSNLLEHLTRAEILSALRSAHRVLRSGGRLLILQPNIRFCARDYWMFFDHITPVDDRALAEALTLSGFDVELCHERFLPFTMVGKRRTPSALIRLYLRVPLLWRLRGQQAFVVARKVVDG